MIIKRVLVRIKPSSKWPKNYLLESLKRIGIKSVLYINWGDPIDDNENVRILVSNNISNEELDKLPKLKYIIIPTSGTEGLDLNEIKNKGIKIIQDKSIVALGVVDYVYDQLKRFSNGEIKKYLEGKKIGLLGFGNIGRRIYKKFASNGCSWEIIREGAWHHNTGQKSIRYFCLNNIDKVIKESDVLINALPLNNHTKKVMIGKTNMIKKGALIVNVSRSGILNERAVLEGVLNRRFSGAIFDVYSEDINPKDYSHPKIVLTPHIAGIYGNSLNRMTRFIKINIESLLVS